MNLVVIGSPGVGKTSASKELAKELKLVFVNEKEFALEQGIGSWDTGENELVVPIKKLEKALNRFLEKKDNIVVEGHLLCECRIKASAVVLLRCNPETLESRLENRGYRAEKVQDNVFCEGIDYCKKHALRNYGKKKLVELESRKTIKETTHAIIQALKKRGFLH